MNKALIRIVLVSVACAVCSAEACADTTAQRYELKITPEFRQNTFIRGTPMLFKVVLADREKQKHLNAVQQAKALNATSPEFTNEVNVAFEGIDWRHLRFFASSSSGSTDSAGVLASGFDLVAVSPEKSSGEGISWVDLRRQATFGVRPDVSVNLAAGEYLISAAYQADSIAVTSAEIRVTIVGGAADQQVVRENKHVAARYYLLRDDPTSAVEVLSQYVAQNPDDRMGLSLLAQAQESSGDEVRAIKSYQEYMRRFMPGDDTGESRSIIQGKIQRLQRAVSLKHLDVPPPVDHQ